MPEHVTAGSENITGGRRNLIGQKTICRLDAENWKRDTFSGRAGSPFESLNRVNCKIRSVFKELPY
jgi:hypothetical protein